MASKTFEELGREKKALLKGYGPGGKAGNEGTAAKKKKELTDDELKRYPSETKSEYEMRIKKAQGL